MKGRIPTLLLTFALCLGWNAHAVHTGTVQPCTPSKPHEVHVLPGFINVHIECERVLLEIPTAMLGRDMLMATEFAALSTGTSEYAPGTSVSNRVVRWLRRGNRVYADIPRFDAWARNAPSLQEGILEAALPTVLAALDVVREGDGGAAIVDVTPLFTSGVPSGFALEFMRHYHMISVDPMRSYVQGVRAFPTNLLLLPEQPMAGRCEDTRVGFFSVPFLDYGTDEHRGVSRAFITRYRLQKKDPSAAVSEPVKPIVFYLSPEIPLKWRPYLKQAVEDWRGPLEKAGFKNAIFAN